MALLPLLALLAAPQATQPNVVVILADDFGVDMVGAYGVGNNPPCTPNLDNLAAQGMLFRKAWVNPSCSPTRGTVMSGRYGFRTGIGSPGGVLALSETTLPEMLVAYESAAIGKWHLGGNNASHPNDSGFDHFAGTTGGGLPDYFNYTKVTNGSQSSVTNYATSEVVDDAISAVVGMQEPWVLYLNFNSVHSPWHVPPASLCPAAGGGCGPGGNGFCNSLGGNPNNTRMANAMAEAMDTEIGRFMTALNGVDPNAYVFFWGDNGTPGQVIDTPFNGAKGSLYEGGINVPLIVKGPGVPAGTECDGLVNGSDMFATLAELSGSSATADDSVSMVPFFAAPNTPVRDFIYAESFDNGQTFPASNHRLAIRGERFKLIRDYQGGISEEFYDMDQDPYEATNLLPNLNPLQQQNYDQLVAQLTALTTPEPGNYCTPGTSASGCQATLSASGTPSATAPSGFVISAANVEGNKNGLFFFGTNGRQANPWGGTSSFQCVVPPVVRGGLLGPSGTIGNCDGAFVQDLNALWCATCPAPLKNPGAGAVTQIQAWYRDPQAQGIPPGQRTALSDAYEFTVLP